MNQSQLVKELLANHKLTSQLISISEAAQMTGTSDKWIRTALVYTHLLELQGRGQIRLVARLLAPASIWRALGRHWRRIVDQRRPATPSF
jgi:hypothetical protein